MSYLFDKWIPNPFLLIISLILFSVCIYRTEDMLTMALTALTLICFGWSISFGKWKKGVKESSSERGEK